MKIIAAVLSLSLILPSVAGADEVLIFQTGNSMWKICNSNARVDQAVCTMYPAGVSDGVALFMGDGKYCQINYPPNVTQQQLGDVFKKYLGDHPEKRHEAASYLSLEAMKEAFGCR